MPRDDEKEACSICDFIPMTDDYGILVHHSPQCPRADEDMTPPERELDAKR